MAESPEELVLPGAIGLANAITASTNGRRSWRLVPTLAPSTPSIRSSSSSSAPGRRQRRAVGSARASLAVESGGSRGELAQALLYGRRELEPALEAYRQGYAQHVEHVEQAPYGLSIRALTKPRGCSRVSRRRPPFTRRKSMTPGSPRRNLAEVWCAAADRVMNLARSNDRRQGCCTVYCRLPLGPARVAR